MSNAFFKEQNQTFNSRFGELEVINGKSAYEIAVEKGFVGTEEEWLASLHGKDGYTPHKGIDYFDGIDGKDGLNGRDGVDGYTPQKGVDYFDGQNGKDGADGYTPVKGTDYFTAEEVAEIEKNAASKVDVPVKDVQINGTSIIDSDVANIPYASDTAAGVVFVKGRLDSGMEIGADGILKAYSADNATITSRGSSRMQLSPSNMDFAVKAAMCDGIGAAWTKEEQGAAQERLGIISVEEVLF